MSPKSEEDRKKALANLLQNLSELPQMPQEDYSWAIHKLESEFPGLTLDRVYGIVPTQAEGRYNGLAVYARYRWDTFSITMGKDNGGRSLPDNEYYYEDEPILSESSGGFLNSAEFYKVFKKGFQKIITGL